jgi:hypothetical protein
MSAWFVFLSHSALNPKSEYLVRLIHFTSFVVFALAGCLDDFSPDVGNELPPIIFEPPMEEDAGPAYTVSFKDDIQPMFRKFEYDCEGCHSGFGMGANQSALYLESYNTLMAGGMSSRDNIVIPGSPNMSVLYLKTGATPPFGEQMPLYMEPMTEADRTMLATWITEGAVNN